MVAGLAGDDRVQAVSAQGAVDMNWMRLYAEFATDPKVQMMSEAMQRRLVMLFCLKCGNGIETFHETERDVSLAFALRISPEETAATKAEFVRRGFINSDWTVRNWNKRQYASDSSTARVRKHRDGRKQGETEQGNNAKRFSNAPEQNRTEQRRKSKRRKQRHRLRRQLCPKCRSGCRSMRGRGLSTCGAESATR